MQRVSCKACGVKNEKLAFLSESPKYTLRFARQIGGLCRAMSITDVARRMHLDWRAVKELDKMYMREQLRVAGPPSPNVIGVDEVSIRKRHTYRIVVSDLEKHRPIWFGCADRSAASMDEFDRISRQRKADQEDPPGGHGHVETVSQLDRQANAPQAAILFDKFHILRHLGESLDKVRKARIRTVWAGRTAPSSKGRSTPCCRTAQNLKVPARARNLQAAAGGQKAAEHRLSASQESFGQLWDYTSEAWARKFFEGWRAQLKWQRLNPPSSSSPP